MSAYVGVCSDKGTASVNRETFCDERSNGLWLLQFYSPAKRLPILFLKSSAEVEPDTGRFVVAYGSFWDNTVYLGMGQILKKHLFANHQQCAKMCT